MRPRLTNDRLLLGMKGMISEMEVASLRERAHAALLQKAQRGALVGCWACSAVGGESPPANLMEMKA